MEEIQQEIKCPHCAETIKAAAKVCRFCSRSVIQAEPVKRKPPTAGRIVVGLIASIVIFYYVFSFIGSMGSPSQGMLRALTPKESTFTLRVSGSPGLKFHGSYLVMHSGSSESKSVEGAVPDSFSVTGMMVSTSFQKQGKGGELVLEILKDGQVIKSADTAAEFGLVTAATQ